MTPSEKIELIYVILVVVMFIGSIGLVAFGKLSETIYTHILVFGMGMIVSKEIFGRKK